MSAETFLLSVLAIALGSLTIIVIAVLWYSYKEEKLKRKSLNASDSQESA